MIIDLILDRKDGDDYRPSEFYFNVLEYGEPGHGITRAMDAGTNRDVQKALADYILDNEYNPALCGYVYSVNWL